MTAERLALVALLSFPAVACLRAPLADPDLWWHLAAGEWIVRHGAVPWTDPFSFTAAGHEWIAYSWLAEIGLYGLASSVGFGAIILCRALAAVLVVAFLFLACRASGARPIVAVAVAALAAAATSGAWSERPMLLTVMLLALTSWLLRRDRRGFGFVAAMVLVHLLWANVHILFVAGLALVGAAAVTAAFAGEPSRGLWFAMAGAALSTLANPYGLHLHAHLPIIAAQPVRMPWIVEFQAPELGSLHAAAAVLLALTAGVAALTARRRPTPFEAVTFLASLVPALVMARNVALFAVLAAPTAARLVEAAIPGGRVAPRLSVLRSGVHVVVALALLALVVSSIPTKRGWRDHIEAGSFPVGAADFLGTHRPQARIFNHFDAGGFLIFRLGPDAKVSIDGRTQVYGQRIVEEYARLAGDAESWRRFLDESAPDVVVWPLGARFERRLRAEPGWRPIYEDETAVIFERLALVSE